MDWHASRMASVRLTMDGPSRAMAGSGQTVHHVSFVTPQVDTGLGTSKQTFKEIRQVHGHDAASVDCKSLESINGKSISIRRLWRPYRIR